MDILIITYIDYY